MNICYVQRSYTTHTCNHRARDVSCSPLRMQPRRRRRWSLLTCLEHGERYFGAHTATLDVPPTHAATLGLRGALPRLPGRLFIASGSLTFDPDEAEAPLMRLVWRDVPRPAFETTDENAGFAIEAHALAVRVEKFQPLRFIRLAPVASGA